MKITKRYAAAILVLLAGCGGGGGGDSSSPSPTSMSAEGLWVGQTSVVAGTPRSLHGLIFENGDSWFFYDGFSAGEGFIHGTASVSGSGLTSSATDYNFAGLGIQSATVSATFSQRGVLNGSVAYATGGLTFTSAYSSQYDLPPVIASVAGSYQRLTITSQGNFTGSLSSGGCQVSGTLTPRSRGNAFVVAMSFGPAPCNNAGATASGIAFFDQPSGILYIAAVTPSGGAALLTAHHP